MFFPTINVWVRRAGRRRLSRIPMFPGYLFLHEALTHVGYIEVCKAQGLVRILGERRDRLAEVCPREIEAIKKVLAAGLPVAPHPYLREGQKVYIRQGPLAGVHGVLLRTKLEKGLLVLSINLLQKSVAVEVDCAFVAAA